MSVLLIVPAAGIGSRLGSSVPKVLHEVAGKPMLDHLAEIHRPYATRWVLVSRPDDEAALTEACRRLDLDAHVAVQPVPTGMLDALLIPRPFVRAAAPDLVWVTWCDQVAIHPFTARRLLTTASVSPRPALVMPTTLRPAPYVHFDRDASQRIVKVRHRREGDAMPEMGETDAGLFSLTRETYLELLSEYDRDAAGTGSATRERNFLPFIPWLQARGVIETFPCVDPMESVGVNTPADQTAVERYLQGRRLPAVL